MPQFPDWKQPVAAWTDATTRAWHATANAVPGRVVVLADRARSNLEHLPAAVAGEVRRRVNLLGLATRGDVEAQGRLGRSRVSFVLKEFLEHQRGHDAALIASLRSELREELQSLAAAIDDDLFAMREPTARIAPDSSMLPRRGIDDPLFDDDDGFDLDDEDPDLTGDAVRTRFTDG